ncbi:hypothetical protein NMG60_11024269 [Bertholletia excelsa]
MPIPSLVIEMPVTLGYSDSKEGGRVTWTEENIRKLLEKHDKNKDNCLTKDEIENAFKDLDAFFPGWRASRGLKYADSNRDGKVDEYEKENLVQYIFKRRYTYHS